MDDDGRMQLPVRSLVLEPESDRHLVIQLDRSGLPGASQTVPDMDIDLGSVESALPGGDLVFDPRTRQVGWRVRNSIGDERSRRPGRSTRAGFGLPTRSAPR